jgi:hypothetical protein
VTASGQQLQTVNPSALEHIDLSTVADSVVGPKDLDAVAADVVSGTLVPSAVHSGIALTS